MELRYEGPIEAGMIFTAPDNSGELGFRRIRLIAEHPDEGRGWIYEDLPSRMLSHGAGRLSICPELNLRIVFVPETALVGSCDRE